MAAFLVLAGAPGGGLEGQTVGAGVRQQAYSFDDPLAAGVASVRLLTIPWAASVSLGSRVDVSVGSVWATATAEGPGGQEVSLSGPSDTDVTVDLEPGPGWLALSATATLPTGRTTLTIQESFVASLVAAELLPFTINSWGSGGSLGGDVAAATQFGAWGVGVSVGYRGAWSYEPIPELPLTYRPGDQLRLTLAFDRDVSTSGTLSFILGVQEFGDDELAGRNLFASGTRIQGLVSLAFALGTRSSAVLYGGVNHRANGTVLVDDAALAGATDAPSQQLFTAGADARVPLWRGATLLPKAEVSVFRAGDGASQGWVGTVGPTVDIRLTGNAAGRRLVLSPSGLLRLGRVVVEEGVESGFEGWEAGVTLRLVPGR